MRGKTDWRPTATWQRLQQRALLLSHCRRFFSERGVLEVDTPSLSRSALPEHHIEPITCCADGSSAGALFLHTSPEAAMKRLLAAGSGPIYQLCHVFRAHEMGPHHHPEFTMLEWYRPGWNWFQLMMEVAELVGQLLDIELPPHPFPLTMSYRQALIQYAGIDLLEENQATLRRHLPADQAAALSDSDYETLLDWFWVDRVEPALARHHPALFITHFPVARAAMARVDPGPPATACRFELYIHGVELANGYQELTDAGEQERRLVAANDQRRLQGLVSLPIDQHFLAALAEGMPECAGVALGFDRLVMLACGATSIDQVTAFHIDS
ncbi:MAG: EF-P lysine aminoacylase GenX [Magnetococcales bacterium]|nr:EF-P lysine aminoacylase GenX [Magnetococcales bacterium]